MVHDPAAPPPFTATRPQRWDVYGRVIDNFGDVGVCWRLCCDLAGRGHAVRLWLDDARALTWMAPQGHPGVEVHPWPWSTSSLWEPTDVVIEAFGCELPDHRVAAMAAQASSPCWINLEYLSAETYVERCHRLPSPQLSGPGQGLTKYFFYPGFSANTGGLIREPGLRQTIDAFDRQAWLSSQGLTVLPGQRLVSLFAYDNPALPALLMALADQPSQLVVPPGPLAEQLRAMGNKLPDHLSLHFIPYLSQPDYDRLLWSCDLNLVRGEDSFVRAQWAGRPFLWQIYPQDDDAHAVKLEAFLTRMLNGAPAHLRHSVSQLHIAWNGLTALNPSTPLACPALDAWTQHALRWRDELTVQLDLCSQLISFVQEAR